MSNSKDVSLRKGRPSPQSVKCARFVVERLFTSDNVWAKQMYKLAHRILAAEEHWQREGEKK